MFSIYTLKILYYLYEMLPCKISSYYVKMIFLLFFFIDF